MKKKQKRGIILSLSYLVIITLYFWTQSRYPGLFRKSDSGLETQIGDTLAFNTLIPHTLGEPFVAEVIISFVNWGFTNWKGMTFGILFGIGIMTLMKYVDIKKLPQNKYVLSMTGYIQGAGLGLCANCATPIGKSLVAGGISPIVAVNTIISSPTFNFVGLGLLIAIFSPLVVAAKLIFYIAIIFVAVPFIFGKHRSQGCALDLSGAKPKKVKYPKWYMAYFENAQFMLKKALPAMALAGFIGVLLVSLIPVEIFANMSVNILSVFMVSLISFLVPVPMFFDMIFAGMLFESSEIPKIFSLIMLFNLGGFSLYPLLVLRENIDAKKLLQFSAIFVFGTPVVAGFVSIFL